MESNLEAHIRDGKRKTKREKHISRAGNRREMRNMRRRRGREGRKEHIFTPIPYMPGTIKCKN